jgi:hypothetical protein
VNGADGVVRPRILVQWTSPADQFVTSGGHIQVVYQPNGANYWLDTPLCDGSATQTYIADVVAGQTYNVMVRSKRANGANSDWVQVNGLTVSTTRSTFSAADVYYVDGTNINLLEPATSGADNTLNAAGQMVKNPSFEAGDDGSWSKGTGWSIAQGTSFDGSWAGKHTGSTDSEIQNIAKSPCAPGQVVLGQALVYGSSANGTIFVQADFYDVNNSLLSSVNFSTGINGNGVSTQGLWQVTKVVAAAPASTAYVKFGVATSGQTAGTWYLDKCSMGFQTSSTDDLPAGQTTTTVPLTAGGTNLVSNGDFELGPNTKPAAGWSTFRSGAHWGYSGGGYNGSTRGYGITSGTGANPAIQYNQVLRVTPGDIYQLQGAILVNAGGSGSILLQFYKSDNTYLSQQGFTGTSTTWNFQTLNVTVPANAYYMQVVLVDNNMSIAAYFDSIGVYKVTQYSNGTDINTLMPAQAGADKTSSNTAAGIANQGALATKNQINYNTDAAGSTIYLNNGGHTYSFKVL